MSFRYGIGHSGAKYPTGSFRKNVKNKSVCTGVNFHKKVVSLVCFGMRNSDKFTL